MSQAEIIGAILLILVFAGLGVVSWVIHRNRTNHRDT